MGSKSLEDVAHLHSNEIYAYLCRFLGDKNTAEDLLGEVYVRLVEQFNKVNDPEFNWRPWMYRVATNLAISHTRKRKVRRLFQLFTALEESLPATSDQAIENNESECHVKEAVNSLGAKHRSIILLRYYQDMSYEEIAAVLKINMGTVKSRLNEAKKKLGEYLSAGGEAL